MIQKAAPCRRPYWSFKGLIGDPRHPRPGPRFWSIFQFFIFFRRWFLASPGLPSDFWDYKTFPLIKIIIFAPGIMPGDGLELDLWRFVFKFSCPKNGFSVITNLFWTNQTATPVATPPKSTIPRRSKWSKLNHFFSFFFWGGGVTLTQKCKLFLRMD